MCVYVSLTQASPTCLPIRRCATHVYSFLRLLTNHLYGNLFLYLSILRRGYQRSELGMPARRQVRGVRAISPNLVPSRWCRFVHAKLGARLWRLATSGRHVNMEQDGHGWISLLVTQMLAFLSQKLLVIRDVSLAACRTGQTCHWRKEWQ